MEGSIKFKYTFVLAINTTLLPYYSTNIYIYTTYVCLTGVENIRSCENLVLFLSFFFLYKKPECKIIFKNDGQTDKI